MRTLKRKVSCTFKREIPLEIQERIYLLAAANSAAQKAIIQRQIEAIPPRGTEIDRLVNDLYPSAGGTAEEIAVVEAQG